MLILLKLHVIVALPAFDGNSIQRQQIRTASESKNVFLPSFLITDVESKLVIMKFKFITI